MTGKSLSYFLLASDMDQDLIFSFKIELDHYVSSKLLLHLLKLSTLKLRSQTADRLND